jgi:acetyl esterase/lipase
MPNQQLEDINQMLRARREEADPDISFPESRAMFEEMVALFPLPEGVSSTPVDAGGIPAEWIRAAGASDKQTIYWLHGGGYIASAPSTRIAASWQAYLLPPARECWRLTTALRRRTRSRQPSKTQSRHTTGCCRRVLTRSRSLSAATRRVAG